jgi:hypothetical protein
MQLNKLRNSVEQSLYLKRDSCSVGHTFLALYVTEASLRSCYEFITGATENCVHTVHTV